MFNRVIIKSVRVIARTDKEKVYIIVYDSGVTFYYLTKNDAFQFSFVNEIQMLNYIRLNHMEVVKNENK